MEKYQENKSINGNITTEKAPGPRPDYILVSCLVIIYLELGWLIMMLLRTYSRD